LKNIRNKKLWLTARFAAMRSVLRGQERSGQKHYFFYPMQGSAQQQAAESYR